MTKQCKAGTRLQQQPSREDEEASFSLYLSLCLSGEECCVPLISVPYRLLPGVPSGRPLPACFPLTDLARVGSFCRPSPHQCPHCLMLSRWVLSSSSSLSVVGSFSDTQSISLLQLAYCYANEQANETIVVTLVKARSRVRNVQAMVVDN